MIYEILRFGYSVLYIDSDVVLLKNPFPYLYAINGYDIIAQSDLHGICSGFMFVKPTNQTICAFEKAIAIAQNVRIDDQTAINEALKETKTPAFQLPSHCFQLDTISSLSTSITGTGKVFCNVVCYI